MTTAAGTVIQLMGSDEQYDLPAFPIVLAYNRLNHYTPTAYLCETSLSDWRLAQMYRHLVCAGDFYCESQEGLNHKVLAQHLKKLAQQMEVIKPHIIERAKRGMYAASSVPISLTGPGPKRSDKLGRFRKEPKSSQNIIQQIKFPGPQFSLLPNCTIDSTCVPDIYEDVPEEEYHHAASLMPAATSASGGVGSSAGTSFQPAVAHQEAQPTRKAKNTAIEKIAKTSEKRGISSAPDNPKDPSYQVEEHGEEEEAQPTSSSSQKESLVTGIPVGHKKRKQSKEKDPAVYKLVCPICHDRFQRSNERKDHNLVVHLNKFYDCVQCVTHYTSERAMKLHFKLKHEGKGRIKCTEEGCSWINNDPGKLHKHLLDAHDIGEPIVCKIENSDGKICNKTFINSRSFQAHKDVHLTKNFECETCNRLFSTEEKRARHIKTYHSSNTEEDKWQCDICGKIFDFEAQLLNHKKIHKLRHHLMLKEAERKKERAAAAAAASSSTQETPSDSGHQEGAQISHPSTGYDLETAMEALEKD